ncbi:glucose 1-dehydrogenase [Paenibacillus alginolyticus]|uniref:Glucose 1-dehydrogenase n=1 Tax=Paenibacillus alginolyticus TaxID=59839 RepID=A0ABT4G5X2_9BACL|nr:glucose 1-dehydrogenase [Paenibacillus alginolyticus]MCY9668541.1 glucose 1-dehydrogenase [Paenibacillus alginolyticus]MCY9691557.1 glucose 1-dehydrogenase [Paenibacillus alginolyticus]MEC0147007.1 glucose 1-dehydrogenase [Paenibacillus alginolyticus]
MSDFKLDGKVALITGGCQGLGLEFSRALANAGASVVVTSREERKAHAAAEEIRRETGKDTLGLTADVTDFSQIQAVVEKVVDTYGRLDILINNAGVNVRKPILDYDEQSWDLVQTTNLKAPFLCAKAVVPQMIKQKFGRIINIASMLGTVALPERSAYCSSKGGLIQLTKVMALEWAEHNITANAVCPGPFATDINQAVINNPVANQFFLDHLPIKRWGKPEELTGLMVYLASDLSSFMTGSAIVIDGGWTSE